MSRFSLFASHLGVLHTLAWRFGSCSAQGYCANNGGALYNNACYIFAEPNVSCTDKCASDGAPCNEGALDMSHSECESVLAILGVDIASTTSEWYSNFGPDDTDDYASGRWYASWFDENFTPFTRGGGSYKTSGCVVSPTFDATDQTSFTSQGSHSGITPADNIDAAEANNFLQETPTCDGASLVYRRVCSCLFSASSPTTPRPTPAPTPPNPSLNPTPAPAPPTPAPSPTTPSPTTPPAPAPPTPAPSPTTPSPTTPSLTTPHPTPSPTQALIEAGYWRTGHASGDIRPCPIPDLCQGGVGGGDDLCIGDNTGPYCQVCPSSHFSSVNGVCLECGSSRGVTAAQLAGLALAAILLMGAAAFIGSANIQAPGTGKNDGTQGSLPLLHAYSTQQSAIDKLREKLLDLGLLVASLRHNLPDTVPQQFGPRVKYLLVTIEMYAVKLIRILPRAPNPELYLGMKEASLQAQLLCPAIDQLASALAGLSGAVSGEEATVIVQIKSSLATARAHDPSAYIRDLPTNDVRNAAKVVLSFAQIMAATPFVLAVKHPKNLRSFLGGLSMVNVSVPKAFFIPCSVQGNFHGELVFKTIGPLVVAAVIGSVQVLLRSSFIATNPAWRGRSMRCNEFLLALTYFVLTPATNAALRTLSCETFDDGRTMLRADYSIDCDAAEYSAYRALAVTMAIAYPIGSLAIYSAVLWKYRHLLYPHQIHGRPTEDNTIAQEAKRANAQTIQPFALLHDAYEPRTWWYEIFETCRRIVLTSLVVFATRPNMQLWIATAFTALSLAMNIVFSPFVGSMDDYLYSSAQLVALALLALALMAETGGGYGDDETSNSVGWVMVVLVAGYIVAALVALVAKWDSPTKGGRPLDVVPGRRPGGASVAKNNEEERRPSLAHLEEGGKSGDEQSTPIQKIEASAIDKQDPIVMSPQEEYTLPEQAPVEKVHLKPSTDTAGVKSFSSLGVEEEKNRYKTDLASYAQTRTRSPRPMRGSRRRYNISPPATIADAQRRAKKKTRAQSLRSFNARRRTTTVAPTDEDLPSKGRGVQEERPTVL